MHTQQQEQSQAQKQQPKQTRFSRKQRIIATVIIVLLVALAIVTAQVLSAAQLIPAIWATISNAIVGTFGMVFAFFALIPLLYAPADLQASPVSAAPSLPASQAIQPPIPPSPPTSSADSPSPERPETIWNVPYRQNPFFTGREQLLKQLHERLTATKATALTQAQAISGLGGIGKTQTAVEYAYRYRSDYHFILWANAVTQTAIIADFVTLATLLQLPEKDEQDQQAVVAAVKRWLATHSDWLLILDNADDLTMVSDFLPTGGNGHILLTTRAQATGTLATSLEVEKLDTGEGTLLLLRRAKLLSLDASLQHAPEQDRATAQAIVQAMDGLPLALDQAGAYIEETGCRLATYLELYQQQQISLLQRRGGVGTEHPESVARTWSLSFAQVEQQSEVAADLLRLCAFLDPDTIPEELFTEGAAELGPVLHVLANNPTELDEAIGVLRRFSLIQRNRDERLLIVHRLVQAVLQDAMNEGTQQQWRERTVHVVSEAIPNVEFIHWSQWERYLSHALICAALIDRGKMTFPKARELLRKTGWYLVERARYAEAEPFLHQALASAEEQLGPEHLETTIYCGTLGLFYRLQGKYVQAEPLFQRALVIREKVLDPDHPGTATALHNLGQLYLVQGRYEEAEPLIRRSLAIEEKVLSPDHPDTAATLHGLGQLYLVQGRYEEAEPLFRRSLAIKEKVLGPEHPETAIILNNLARLYYTQGRYEEAESLYQRALAIKEKVLTPDHLEIAITLENYVNLLHEMNRLEETTTFEQRAKAIRAREFSKRNP